MTISSFEEARRHVASLSPKDKAALDKLLGASLENERAIGRLETLRQWKPRPYQLPLWDYLHTGGKRACVIWHRRCFVGSTRVVMADGQWRPISELRVGDAVLSWDGEKTLSARVTNVWRAGMKPVRTYAAAGFPAVTATPDHRFFGFHPQWQKAGWVSASEIERRHLSVGQFSRGLDGSVSCEDLAELIGYLVTDGYVTHGQQPKFTNTNKELIDRVAELARSIFLVVPMLRRKGRGFDLGLSNGTAGGGETPNPVKEWFLINGALGAKRERCLPAHAWSWDDASIWRFFGAVLAGDGSIYAGTSDKRVVDASRGERSIRAGAQVSIHAGVSRKLADDYVSLLRKVGVVSWVSKQTKGENWIVRISRQDCIRRLLENVTVIGKEAKRVAALSLCSGRRERQERYGCEKAFFHSVEAGFQETWDIEVEGTHCFFAEGYLVHNSGKDDVALNWTAEAVHRRVAEYWHMLPEAAQGRKVIWNAVNPHTGRRRIDQAFPEELRAFTRNDEMVIGFKNGSLWRVVGSDNYNSLMGATPAGVIFSEWALADPAAWAFLRPILMENGGWALFITTPRGPNHAKTTYDLARQEDGWFAEILTAEKTNVFTEEQLATELRELQHDYGQEEGAALFEQEYRCSFESALVGSYYGAALSRAQREGRIGKVPVDRGVLVHTAWDLGISDSTAIWFVQCVGKERRFVDYIEMSGVGLDEYARLLEDKRKERGWTYGLHYFPHDIVHRELGNRGLSREDTLRALGIKPMVVPASNVNDGINAVRRMLDFAWIDETFCERGLNALRNYRREWNDKLRMFADKPLHDWASHGADSLRTFAAGHRDAKSKPEATPKLPVINAGSPRDRGTNWLRGR